jgi:hypothetical protein
MTRIGTGLGAKVRTYTARASTTFRRLESAVTDQTTAPVPGSVVVLSATNAVRTLDSSYTQGILIRNPSTTVSLFVAGEEYVGTACATPGNADTAWEIPPSQSQRFDVRDGTGLCVGVLAATLDIRVVGN